MTKKIVQKNELESLVVYVQEKTETGYQTIAKMPVFHTHTTKDGFPIYKTQSQDRLIISIFKPL